jgi:hypothetical protein
METNITVPLPTALPTNVLKAGGFSINGTHFIFCGPERTIIQFNEKTEAADIIGDLPFQNGTSNVLSTAAIPNGQGGVWLFGGSHPKATNPILLFNTASKSVFIPTRNTTSLTTLYETPAAVWDGRHGYLIGGFGWYPESSGKYHPTNGIIK